MQSCKSNKNRRFGAIASVAGALALGMVGGQSAMAQCVEGWLPGVVSTDTWTGVNGTVNASIVWDPDGAGPLNPRVVIGGAFTIAGATAVTNIAQWDGTQWLPMGTPNGTIFSFGVHQGALFCGGGFTSISGVGIRRVARWDGAAWQNINGTAGTANGVDGVVYSFASTGSVLYFGGLFQTAWQGGVQNRAQIASFDGTSINAVGAGVQSTAPFSAAVRALYYDTATGILHVGGDFQRANNVASKGYARWTPSTSTWTAGPQFDESVLAITKHNGRIVVGGNFTTHTNGVVPAPAIGEFSGSTFLPYGSGVTTFTTPKVTSLVSQDGFLYAAGKFPSVGGTPAACIARWSGNAPSGGSWTPAGSGLANVNQQINTLTSYQNCVIAAGAFTGVGGTDATNIARFDGTGWSHLRPALGGFVAALLPFGSGVYAGGYFNYYRGGSVTNNLVSASPAGDTLFVSDGSGFHGTNSNIRSLVYRSINIVNTSLIIGGAFTSAGGLTANRIATWQLAGGWGTFGTGFNNQVFAQRATGTGAAAPFYVTGAFTTASGVAANRIARFQSGAWSGLGSGLNGTGACLTIYQGQLHVGGSFTTANGVATGGIARWDGTTFQQLGGNFLGTVLAMTEYDGKLIVGGLFPGLPGCRNIAMWNGSNWAPMGGGLGDASNSVEALVVYNGILYAGGNFGNVPGMPRFLARWTGSSWETAAGGADAPVSALTVSGGRLWAGGSFNRVDGMFSPALASWTECPCPADVDNDGDASNGMLRDGGVDINDLIGYLEAFQLGLPSADLDNDGDPAVGTPDGGVDINDLLYFLPHFEAGC